MAWDKTRPADAKYRTKEHRDERARWVAYLSEQGVVECAQPECVMESRLIYDGEPWHLGHDAKGSEFIGPTHPRCNVVDGAKRGNRARALPLDGNAWSL